MRDHFAILKVGPGATYRVARSALGARRHRAGAAEGDGRVPDLRKVVVASMRADPQHWRGHYHGEGESLDFDLQYSLSDRIRYYWPYPEVQRAVAAMLRAARPAPDSAHAPQPVPAAPARCRARRAHRGHDGRDPARRRRGGVAALHRCLRRPVEGGGMSTNGIPGLAGGRARVARRGLDRARDCAAAGSVDRGRRPRRPRSARRSMRFLQPLVANPRLRVVLTGAGTSAYIGDCLAPALSARLRRRVEAIATTDLLSGPDLRLPSDGPTLLVSFARSGNSPESVAAVELAEQFLAGRVFHLVITCNAEGALAARAQATAECARAADARRRARPRLRDDLELQRDAARGGACLRARGRRRAAAPRALPRRSCCRRRRRSPGAWSRAASSASCTSAATSCAGSRRRRPSSSWS